MLVAGPWPRPLMIPNDLPAIAMKIVIRMMGNGLGQSVFLPASGKLSPWPFVRNVWLEEWRTGGLGIRLLPVLMALDYPSAGLWVYLWE